MSFSGIFAQIVALIGAAALQWRRMQGVPPEPAWGSAPVVPAAKPQGAIPTLKMPTAQGWAEGQKPRGRAGAQGQCVRDRSRSIRAGSTCCPMATSSLPRRRRSPDRCRSLFGYAMQATMRRAGALGVSANRITLLRDKDGDGIAETREVFMEGLNQPFGMALSGDTFYVGNTDGVVAFPYVAGADRITAPGRKLVPFKPGGHWTRSLLPSPDGGKLYAGRGLAQQYRRERHGGGGRPRLPSTSSIWRAARAASLPAACATRWAWHGSRRTGVLWTVVNERDGLGDETPPDYLTSVRDGGFYGWPYCYWGQTVDDRVPQDPAAVAKAITPDYALGGHTASLGLCWLPAGTLPGFPDGMAIGQHGSWNRSTLSGYKVVFVPFVNGRPAGPARDILSGFLAPDEKVSYGRPVGVTLGPDGSLLVADDVGDVIWRVTGA